MAELLEFPEAQDNEGWFGANLTEVWKAAQVSRFMLPVVDAAGGIIEHGRWRLQVFEIDEWKATVERLTAIEQRHDRFVPEGRYVSLQRHATREEREEVQHLKPPDPMWVTVMSDTPDEINDHADILAWAQGRVLVHGLGLGCVVAGLLARKGVEHIDVVEIDADVIALTGQFYADDPRVTIHHDSCVDKVWTPGTRWNYVWHDIWTSISADNLHEDRAEHGITYGRLHRMFGHRTDYQFSWAFEHAKRVRTRQRQDAIRELKFAEKYAHASVDQRVIMTFEKCRREQGGGLIGDIPRDSGFWLCYFSGMLDQWKEAAEAFTTEKYEDWKARTEKLAA